MVEGWFPTGAQIRWDTVFAVIGKTASIKEFSRSKRFEGLGGQNFGLKSNPDERQ
jgi:hypothetical protein